jgi:hypothetical protein
MTTGVLDHRRASRRRDVDGDDGSDAMGRKGMQKIPGTRDMRHTVSERPSGSGV